MTGVLIGKGEDTRVHRKEGHVKTEAELEVMQLHTKGPQGMPGATRN